MGMVADSRKSMLFPLCAGSNAINAIIFFFIYIFICFIRSCLDNIFNIYTKRPLNGTLANTNTHIRDATECVNSIGNGLFGDIKVIFSN